MAAGKRDRLMTSGEWDDFWLMIESKRAFYDTPQAKVLMQAARPAPARRPLSPQAMVGGGVSKGREQEMAPKGRNQRSNRCGTCAACRAQDCGRCKNCKDKPRFGGPGIKKKACLARICHRADDIGSDDDTATIPLEMPSSTSSPPSCTWSRRASHESAARCDGQDAEGPEAGEDEGAEYGVQDSEPAGAGCNSPTPSGSTNVSRIASVGPSQLASPAIRPASPPHGVKDARGERWPLSPLGSVSPTPNSTLGSDARCGVDVLSLMASQIPSG